MLEQHRAEQYPWPKWRVLARVRVEPEALRSEYLLRLLASGELELNPYPEKETTALWAQKEWGPEVDWAILSPEGTLAGTGGGGPVVAALEDPIRKSGWKSRAQVFAELVKAKDGSGEAWGEALVDAARLREFIEAQLYADTTKPRPWWIWEIPAPDPLLLSLKEASEKEWSKALDGLRRHPGYERWQGLAGVLALAPPAPSAAMKDALRPTIQDLIRELHHTPQSASLWAAWSQVASRLPSEASEFTPSLFAVPQGDPWPPPAGLRAVLPLLRARGDLRTLLSYCGNQLQAPFPRDLRSDVDWRRERLQRIQDWGLPGLEALVRLKAESDGLVWIEELHRLWGKDWATSNLHAFIRGIDRDWLPESWDKALRAEALEDPPPQADQAPSPTPSLALDTGKDRALERGWKALRDSPTLDAWGPADLHWTSFSTEGLRRLRQDYGLDAKPRWFLLRGSDLIASGTTVPDPTFVQDRLHSLGTPRLELLTIFLSRNPEQLEARMERFQLLRDRLPQPRLEADFREDAKAALLPVSPEGDWAPMGETWTRAAREVIPRLEQQLRHWPSNLAAWKAWMAWSEIHPLKPRALELAASLEPWPALRLEAAQLIAGQMRNRGEWKALQAFAQVRWDAIALRAQAIHPAIPPLDPRLGNDLGVWLSFLEDAYAAQGKASAIPPLRSNFAELTLRKAPGH